VLAVALLSALAGCREGHKASEADGIPGIEPYVIDFGRRPMYSRVEQEVRIANHGRAVLEVEEAWVEGPGGTFRAQFVEPGPHRLMPGAGTTLKVRFSPQGAGDISGRLVVRSNSYVQPVGRVQLRGQGVDTAARISPDFLDYGRIEAQARKSLPLTLTNPSDVATLVTLRPVGADADEFAVPAPLQLGPNETRQVPVDWAPQRVGRKAVALSVTPCDGCTASVVRVAAEALDRAVIAEPPALIFGQTPLDREAFRTVTLRNISTEPATVNGSALTASTDPAFTVVADNLPVTLPAGGTHVVELRYSPGRLGEARGQVDFSVQSVRNPTLPVELNGYGGAPEVCVSPVEHDFRTQPVGSKTGVTVRIKNCGTRNAAPLTVTSVAFDPRHDGGRPQFTLGPVLLPTTLAAGEEMVVRAFFEPTEAGPHATTLRIRTGGVALNEVPVALRGTGRAIPPCDVRLTPTVVDFGTVAPGWGAVLGIRVENVGTDVCPVKNFRLANDGGGVFNFPGGAIDGVLMYGPGEYFTFQVGFRAPAAGGTFFGSVQLEVGDPLNPVREVPLLAHSQESCLVPKPNYVDFGVAWATCPARAREVNFLNACTTPVSVLSAAIGPGTADGEFVLTEGLGAPRDLAPGDAFTLEVDYLARVGGMNLSPLYVDAVGLAEPLMVPLIGEASRNFRRTERFVQTDGRKVDVLFVVDNSDTMVEEQPRLVQAVPAFAQAALARGVDLHVAVTTTGMVPVSNACPGGAQGGEAGRFFPVDNSRPRVLTAATPNLAGLLQQNVQVGLCTDTEQGFEAARRALSPPLSTNANDARTPQPNDGNLGFLRDEAALAVVFVSDEDDHSPDEVETYVSYLRTLKGAGQPQRVSLFAIAPPRAGCATAGGAGGRYAEAARLTGGDVLSVCAPDYQPFLQQVAQRAFSPQDRFALADTPEPGSLVVRVDGQVVTNWTYAAADNAVVFDVQPAPGAQIEVQYQRTCR
jgi:hypothetical protein